MKIGDIVEIEFRDHAKGDESILFCVWGRIIKRTRRDITVAVWAYSDPKYKAPADDPNVEKYTIARDAILSYRVFR